MKIPTVADVMTAGRAIEAIWGAPITQALIAAAKAKWAASWSAEDRQQLADNFERGLANRADAHERATRPDGPLE
jgi:hypothetical protein